MKQESSNIRSNMKKKPPLAKDLTFLESLDATRQASGHFGFKAFGLGIRAPRGV